MMILFKVVKGRSENLVMVVLWRDKYLVMLARNERSPSSATLSLELTLDTIYYHLFTIWQLVKMGKKIGKLLKKSGYSLKGGL